MPNKFTNTLVVTGGSLTVNRFIKRARGRQVVYLPADHDAEGKSGRPTGGVPQEVLLSFQALYPVPPEVLVGGDAKVGERWQRDHWGCKSDNEPGQVTVRRLGPNKVEYLFETLEGPPLKWLERVAEDFPTLDFDLYFIAAWEVHGRRTYTRGELIQDWEEQPTSEDRARAGLLNEDYCATCGEPLSEDGGRCPHCDLLTLAGGGDGPQETAPPGAPADLAADQAVKPAPRPSGSRVAQDTLADAQHGQAARRES